MRSLRLRTKGLGKRSLRQHPVVTLGLLLSLWLPLEKHYDWQTFFRLRLRRHVPDSRLWSGHPQRPRCWYRGPLGLPQLHRGPGDAGRAGQWPGWQARAPECQVRVITRHHGQENFSLSGTHTDAARHPRVPWTTTDLCLTSSRWESLILSEIIQTLTSGKYL